MADMRLNLTDDNSDGSPIVSPKFSGVEAVANKSIPVHTPESADTQRTPHHEKLASSRKSRRNKKNVDYRDARPYSKKLDYPKKD